MVQFFKSAKTMSFFSPDELYMTKTISKMEHALYDFWHISKDKVIPYGSLSDKFS